MTPEEDRGTATGNNLVNLGRVHGQTDKEADRLVTNTALPYQGGVTSGDVEPESESSF